MFDPTGIIINHGRIEVRLLDKMQPVKNCSNLALFASGSSHTNVNSYPVFNRLGVVEAVLQKKLWMIKLVGDDFLL